MDAIQLNKLKLEKSKSINSLIQYFKTKNIIFSETDNELDNVVFTFTKTDKSVKIAHEMFYRYSGMIKYFKPTGSKGKDKTKIIFGEFETITDDMFYERLKLIILYAFGIENK